ncbi:hypothetical protein [Amnibacterium kyonggiense]|uniref:Sulfotransferase family protein n=1 Tax=Amnibacterium kyonggiense TaxID=595671 RepID=A0A4R7FT03_9MICO|nr:hypothetical protein [Amnibacterium kyonggiense]TDS80908.1 hypothetical protein CLV52_1479 [Amnibacterium kyonggiense]
MSLLLPEGSRLLHIGPAKTGTTSLQSAFHTNRAAIAAYGVHYAGRNSQPRAAAGAVALGRRIAGHRDGLEAWPRLVREIDESTAKRIVISSETFARADDERAATVIEALGADRTTVVITMRPLADMLPSSWQQWVQTGSRTSWPDWLDAMLRTEDTLTAPQPEFWQKTRIDALARRWSRLVGRDNVVVLSLAGAARDFPLRTFEAFTGLPEGVLVPDPRAENASPGYAVAETIRHFNARFAELDGATADVQAALVEFGAIRRLREQPELLRAGGPIEVPQWAADRAAELVREMVHGIRELGVRTIGNLDALAVPSRRPVAALQPPPALPTEAAAALLVGMMLTQGRGVPTFDSFRAAPKPPPPPPADLDTVGTRRLMSYTAGRIGDRVRARLRTEPSAAPVPSEA